MVESVMVVDDESIVTMHLEESLTELGYRVVGTASSGEEAVEKARILNPRVVLMDIVMPGEKDGITAAEEIQSEFDIPVIFLTAYTDKELVERAKRTLPSGYVVKPFQANELCAVIEIALHKHKLNRRLRKSEGVLREAVKRLKRDNADRARSMEELQQAYEGLQRINEDLQKRIEEAERFEGKPAREEKMAYVRKLTAGVSHEMLQSLSTITFLVELLLNDQGTPPEMVLVLNVLKEKVSRTAQINHDLLAFAEHRPLDLKEMDLNVPVKGAVDLLEEELRDGGITVKLDLSEVLPPVEADEDYIQQCVVKLLTNARDFMPEGGEVVISTKAVPVEGELFLELRVEDTGPGIDPEHMERIFQPFFTTKPEGAGTGLGLSMCKGIVESHGGSIWAENVPGGGAAFIIRPRVERQ